VNNDPRGAWSKDQIGWIMTRIHDPKQSAEVARRIDATFDGRDDQTRTMSEQVFQRYLLTSLPAVTIRDDGAIRLEGRLVPKLGVDDFAFTGAPETRRSIAMAWAVLVVVGLDGR
jgi:hypothetical protein